MTNVMNGWTLGAALLLCGACSLRSLDYLGDPGPSSEGGSSSAGTGPSGGQGGATAGVASGGGGSASGGSSHDAGSENAGAAGVPPEIPDCDDKAQTVDETDIDCGGRTCAPCADHQKCAAGTDCESAICTNQVCQPASCTDLAVNGDETDLNCGGACPKCAQGQRCGDDADCLTGECGEDACYSPACSDDVLQDGCPLLVDNTAYLLTPEHAPSKCVDDTGRSLAEGTRMILYTCNAESHQTFWAVAKEGGYFALRNALSGKCLQVRDASMADAAVIEQGNCDYSPQQLWMPTRVDDQHMSLRSKLSGLALDVAGDEVASDYQAIVQGAQTDSADTHWRLQKSVAAAHIAISPNDDKSLHIRHGGPFATLASDDGASAHWRVVSGLSDPSGVSFESRDDPGRYLRHSSFRIWSDKNDGSDLFKSDATFRYVSPFVGSSSFSCGLEATNYRGLFLRRDGDVIRLAPFTDSAEFRSDATWWLGAR
jgi:hypothetical protein